MDLNNVNTKNIALKTCSGCLKAYTFEFFNGKKTCNACRLSNKNRRATLRTNQKRQIEEHEKINHIYIEDLAEIIIENIATFKENIHPENSNNFKVSCFIDIAEFYDFNSKVIADNVAEVVSEADEYNWM